MLRQELCKASDAEKWAPYHQESWHTHLSVILGARLQVVQHQGDLFRGFLNALLLQRCKGKEIEQTLVATKRILAVYASLIPTL